MGLAYHMEWLLLLCSRTHVVNGPTQLPWKHFSCILIKRHTRDYRTLLENYDFRDTNLNRGNVGPMERKSLSQSSEWIPLQDMSPCLHPPKPLRWGKF